MAFSTAVQKAPQDDELPSRDPELPSRNPELKWINSYFDRIFEIQVGNMVDEVFASSNSIEENRIICGAIQQALGSHLSSPISSRDFDKKEKLIDALKKAYHDKDDKLAEFLRVVRAGDLGTLRANHPLRTYESKPRHLFDGFGLSNDGSGNYYRKPESKRTRACVSVEWVAFAEIMQDMDWIYVPCGISSGLRPHELIRKGNKSRTEPVRTTHKAQQALGDMHGSHVVGPNVFDNLLRARIILDDHQWGKFGIIPPTDREASVRAFNESGAFSRWQPYEEEDFMALWYPVIDRCKGMVLDGDWNFSRNSIWEMMRGVLIQAGQIPSRPKADMDVKDLKGNPVTLLMRAEKAAEMLEYQLGYGFEAREAATALAQIFTLDDKIRNREIPADKLHPVLRNRQDAELAAMQALKERIKPLLKAHCAHYMRLDDLPAEYQDAADTAKDLSEEELTPFKRIAERISRDRETRLSVTLSEDQLTDKPEDSDRVPQPQRLFDSHERFFEEDSKAKMFEDHLYDKLPEWERVALPFAIGATEIGLYPANKPMATMILTDLKRGKVGFNRGQAKGSGGLNKVDDANELAGALGSDVATNVVINLDKAETLKQKLKDENPGKIVVNTPSFLRIADAIEYFRSDYYGFVAAEGPPKTSPDMRLALQMKFLDRNVDRVIFQEGWEYSNDLVQLRVRARMIQAGLIDRPAGKQSRLRVYSAANTAKKETLLDDIRILMKEVKRAADSNVRATEQALALARLLMIHELRTNHELRNGGGKVTRQLIDPLTIEPSMAAYDCGTPASLEFHVGKILDALNDPDDLEGSATRRQTLMAKLKAAYSVGELPEDLLTNKDTLSDFIKAKHGDTGQAAREFLERLDPKLIDPQTFFDEAKDLLVNKKTAKAAGWIGSERFTGEIAHGKGEEKKAPKAPDPNRLAAKEIERGLVQEYITAGEEQRKKQKWGQQETPRGETLVDDPGARR
jgi:hypothetical protein